MPGTHISYAAQNFEGLSYLIQDVPSVALVTEGGGQRGIFTAGVLDAFLNAGFNPFGLLIGTSSGALNLASYICGQEKHAYRVITEATTSQNFFALKRFLTGKGGLDLDWLVQQAKSGLVLDWNAGRENMRHRTVLASACGLSQHQACYFNLAEDDWQLALKATCSIPLLHTKPVQNESERYVDGGVCAPIPVQEAYRRGYNHIVVVRTMPVEFYREHQWLKGISKWMKKTRVAELVQLLVEHEESYRKTQEFLAIPPDDVTIYEIHPNKTLGSKLIGSSMDALERDYELGLKSGRYFLNSVGRRIVSPSVLSLSKESGSRGTSPLL
ncbi:patatin family protein [Endozoicomonas sp. 4G]|uniref:patatin-like phospholipase family protein n=1 Tax=Endozoicomonas sp. 4G TaxID=2872754 RepID=UPI0020786ACD|nr:patatin family protein [Endozoicomonas sp. 4G]